MMMMMITMIQRDSQTSSCKKACKVNARVKLLILCSSWDFPMCWLHPCTVYPKCIHSFSHMQHMCKHTDVEELI